MANTRIKRDMDDRLADRVAEVKARAETDDDKGKRERIEAFRDKWANNALPDIPEGTIPGFHLCWLSTTNKDRKSTRLNSSHTDISRMPSSA